VKHTPPALAYLRGELARLEGLGLLRTPARRPDGAVLFCSNDYLGLADRVTSGRAGSGASRLVSGDRDEHRELERALASWLGTAGAQLFSSGYAANVGALSALASEGDLVVSDELNHASIIDGARLSRAKVVIVPHLDVAAVERALVAGPRAKEGAPGPRSWVVTESYFSMDADTPDLQRLRALCDEHGAGLYVDEAHAVGVMGPEGRGLCAAAGVSADVLVGTLGKAFGASGAFVAGCDELTRWLWNRARSFVFSTGPSPVASHAGLEGLHLATGSPELRNRVAAAAEMLRAGLRELGIAPLGWGHIVPWVVGDDRRATEIARALLERGFIVVAIRPPSVAPGTARLRLTATAAHTRTDIDGLLAAVRDLAGGSFT